jgi:hypothetical protein
MAAECDTCVSAEQRVVAIEAGLADVAARVESLATQADEHDVSLGVHRRDINEIGGIVNRLVATLKKLAR